MKAQASILRADMDRQNAREALRQKRNEMIAGVADTVALDWYRRCIRTGMPRMTLYWRKPREGERAALPIIDTSPPSDEWTAHCEISPALTRNRVAAIVGDAMHGLPMLAEEWF